MDAVLNTHVKHSGTQPGYLLNMIKIWFNASRISATWHYYKSIQQSGAATTDSVHAANHFFNEKILTYRKF